MNGKEDRRALVRPTATLPGASVRSRRLGYARFLAPRRLAFGSSERTQGMTTAVRHEEGLA